jgi:DNA gyrase subunit A
MRVVIELSKDANEELVMNQLYKHTRLQTTIGITMLALVDNKPQVLSISDVLSHYLSHRKEVVVRRTRFELSKAEERAHILEGIIKALDDVDLAIKLIRGAKAVADARASLMDSFSLTEVQANAILELRLQKLASLEQEKIRSEHKDLLARVAELKAILADEQKVYSIIKEELLELREKYGDERRSQITDEEMVELEMEDLVEKEDMVVTVTARGYIKRQSMDAYRQQKRGGVGIIAANAREEDSIKDIFIANTHWYLLFFTDKGNVYWLKAYYLPEGSRTSGGKAIVNLLNLKEEKITAYIPIKDFSLGGYLTMATSKGMIKKTSLEQYSRPRKGGIIAVNLQEGDRLVDVMLTSGSEQLLLATRNGMAVKFKESDVRAVGRNSIGVRGIRLKTGDSVVSLVKAPDAKTLLTITENGYGKRTAISDYRLINRGGSGVRNIITNARNGGVVDVLVVDGEEFMTITRNGVAMRTSSVNISVIGRNTQGVRIMKLREDDKVVSMAKILKE